MLISRAHGVFFANLRARHHPTHGASGDACWRTGTATGSISDSLCKRHVVKMSNVHETSTRTPRLLQGDAHRRSLKISGSELLDNLQKKCWLWGCFRGGVVRHGPKKRSERTATFVVWALSTQRCMAACRGYFIRPTRRRGVMTTSTPWYSVPKKFHSRLLHRTLTYTQHNSGNAF